MGSKSSSASTSNSTKITTSTNSNLQDIEGLALSSSSGNKINITDSGAIEKIGNVTIKALEQQNKTSQGAFTALNLGQSKAFSTTLQAVDKAFLFGKDVNSKAKSAIDNAVNKSLSFSERAGNNALKFAYDAGRPEAAALDKQMKLFGGIVLLLVLAGLALRFKKGKK